MKLIGYETLATHLNLASHIANEASLGSAIESATTFIEGVLRTSLVARDREDYFSPRRSRLGDFKPFNLYLTQKFATGIAVYASSDGLPLLSTTADNATLLVEGTDWIQENEFGDVQVIRDWGVGPHTMIVKYSCGFTDETDETLPEWMKSAALSAATLIKHTNSIGHNKKDFKDLSPEIRTQLYAMLAPYIVPSMGFTFPSKSVIV